MDAALITVLALVAAFTAYVVVSILWLQRLRDNLRKALREAAGNQVGFNKKMADIIQLMQQQQKQHEVHLQKLAEANLRMRQDFASLTERMIDDGNSQQPQRVRVVH